MKKAYFYTYIGSLLILLAFTASCGGQKNANLSEDNQLTNELFTFLDADSDPQIAEYIRHIFQDKNGHFWFGTNNYGVAYFDGNSLSYFSTGQGFNGGQITGITEDQEKNIWFATDQGIVKYDWATKENGEKIFTNFTNDEVFKGKYVWSIFADSKGVIWVGTNDGVFLFDGSKLEPFDLPYSEEGERGGLFTNRTIWSITEDGDGNIWIGTNGNGTFKYDPSDKIKTGSPSITRYTEKDGLTDNSVDPILADRDGNLWFGTRNGGLSHYDGKTFTNYTEKDSIGNNEVCIIFEDKVGNIWFSSEGYGVYRYNPSTASSNGGKSFTNFYLEQGLGVKAVQTIFEDKEGRLWVGGGGGLYRFDPLAEQVGMKSFINVTKNGPWE